MQTSDPPNPIHTLMGEVPEMANQQVVLQDLCHAPYSKFKEPNRISISKQSVFCWKTYFVFSVLDYEESLYAHAAASTLQTLNAVYHSAVCFILADTYPACHGKLYKMEGQASLAFAYFIYRALLSKVPRYLTTLIESSIPDLGLHDTLFEKTLS